MKKLIFLLMIFFSVSIFAQSEIGASCSSDLQCGSLCCDPTSETCAPHDPTGKNPVMCNKPAGQTCVSREFCAQSAVITCKIVKTGILNGRVTCVLRCPAVMTYGDCVDFRCVAPVQPQVPVFDPNDCSNAVDP